MAVDEGRLIEVLAAGVKLTDFELHGHLSTLSGGLLLAIRHAVIDGVNLAIADQGNGASMAARRVEHLCGDLSSNPFVGAKIEPVLERRLARRRDRESEWRGHLMYPFRGG